MKKFKTFIVIAFSLCLLLSSLIAPNVKNSDVLAKTSASRVADTVKGLSLNTSTVRVELVDSTRKSYTTADKDGKITAYINALDDIPEGLNISVYYRTIDATAVSGIEYKGVPTVYGKDSGTSDVNGKVILTKNNPSKLIEIETEYVSQSLEIDGEKNVPYFELEIYHVENARLTSRKKMTCYLNVETYLSAKKVTDSDVHCDGTYVFKEYLTGGEADCGTSPTMDTDPGDDQYPDWFVVPKMSDTKKSATWSNEFIATGIASPYVTFTCNVNGMGNGDEHYYLSDDFGDWTTKDYKDHKEDWIEFNTTKVHIKQDEVGINWNDNAIFAGISMEKFLQLMDKAFKDYYGDKVPDVSKLDKESYFTSQTVAKYSGDIPKSIFNSEYYKIEGGEFVHYFDDDWVPFEYANSQDVTDKVKLKSSSDYLGNAVDYGSYFWWNFSSIEDGETTNYSDAMEYLAQFYLSTSMYHRFDYSDYDFTSLSMFPESAQLAEKYKWMFSGLQRMYFAVDSLDVAIRVFQDSSCERVVSNFHVYYILDDQDKPIIDKNGNIKVNDLNYASDGNDRTRIIIPFSEPVYVSNGEDLVVQGYANNDSNFPVVFKYAGGSGSKYLFFDLDKAELKNTYSNINITNVTLQKLYSKSGAYVSDYSRYGFKLDNNCVKGKTVRLDYDLRIPTLTALNCSTSGAYANTQNVTLKYSNVSKEGNILYTWREKTQGEPTLDEYTESTPVVGTTKTLKSTDGDGDVIKNGEWTLYVKLVSALGKTGDESMGQITVRIDNELPQIDQNNDFSVDKGSTNNKTTHTFDFCAVDKYSTISQIKFFYSTTPFTGLGDFKGDTLTVYDYTSSKINDSFYSYVTPKMTDLNMMPCHFQVDNMQVHVVDGSQAFYIGVVVLDMAKNQSEMYIYNDTVRFSGLSSLPMSAEPILSTGQTDKFSAYEDIVVVNSGKVLCTTDKQIEGIDIKSVKVGSCVYAESIDENGRTVCTDLKDDCKCEYTVNVAENKLKATVTLPKNPDGSFKEGCYDLCLTATYEYEGVTHKLNTNTVRVYVYGGTPDTNTSVNLTNLKGRNGLISKVYMLDSEAKYFYMPTGGSTNNSSFSGAVSVSYCEDVGKSAIFSSEDKAKEYIKFMEQQDVMLLRIDSQNFSSVKQQMGYKLADPNKEVIQGEYWIRYKSANWLPTTNNTDWEYYYYGAGDGTINWSRVKNSTLERAINTVTNRIVELYGSEVYVHDDYYNIDGTLDSYGTPTFNVSQLHVDNLKVTQSMSGTGYFIPLDYSADVAMYENAISIATYSQKGYTMLYGYSFDMEFGVEPDVNDKEALRMQEIRKIFYVDATKEGAELKQLFPTNGVYNLRDLPESAQEYTIYELSETGFCQYNILVDRDAPTVDIFYVRNDVEETITLKKEQHNGYYVFAQHLALQQLNDFLDSSYSYVALFRKRYTSMEYYGTYLPSELDGTVQLEEGNYIMQVYDRSGNNFSVSLFINNQPLDCVIKNIENRYIQLNVNDRTAQEIDTYEVWRDGKLLPYSFAESQSFYDSGTYTFIVKDKYGNPTWTATEKFERTTPQVSVRYLKDGEQDTYVAYNDKTNDLPLYMEDVGGSTFEIYTRTKLRFTYDSNAGYEFAFTGHFANYSLTTNSAGLTMITLTKVADCRLKVWYTKYPTAFVYYDVFADTSAPIIDLATDIQTYLYDDTEQINQNCYKTTFGNAISADSVKYSITSSEKGIISNKAIVFSDDILGNISDVSPLKRAVLYIDGKIVKEYVRPTDVNKVTSIPDINITEGVDGQILYGTYRIEAEDIIGNTAIIEFTNNNPDNYRVYTDDVKDSAYGKDNFTIELDNQCNIYMTVAYGDNQPVYKVFSLLSSGFYEDRYIATGSEYRREVEFQTYNMLYEIIPNDLGDTIRNAEKDVMSRRKWYPVNVDGIENMQIYFDSGKTVKLLIPSNPDCKVKVCVRIELGGNSLVAPLYRECTLYTKMSDIVLETIDGEEVVTNQTETIIYVKDNFFIDSNQNLEEIDFIEVGTSEQGVEYGMNYETMKLTSLKDVVKKFNMSEVYKQGVSLKQVEYTENIHYLVHVRNIYGLDTYYYISKSQTFELDAKATYFDGFTNTYTKNNYSEDETVYSNSFVELFAYASGFDSVTVKKADGDNLIPYIIDDPTLNGMTDKGYYYVYLNNVGIYEVCFEDIYGHSFTRKVEIGSKEISINKEELIEFNYTPDELENMSPIKKVDYTFKNVDLNPDAFGRDVVYIAVKFGSEQPKVLLNMLSATDRMPLNGRLLMDVLGDFGDGAYDLEFRNQYGDCYTRTLYYQSTPMISVIRQTRTVQDDEISLEDLQTYGIWTNASFTVTGSNDAILEKNGSKVPLPFTDEYSSSASEGKTEYVLHYYDEYGYDFEMNVHIVRSTISLEFADTMDIQKINNLDTTTSDVSVAFKEEDGVTCTYSYDGGEYQEYVSGTKLQKDGMYSFIISDRAGNISTKIIRRDTFVEYSFTNQNTGRKIINGEFVNDIVYFAAPTSDTTYLKTILLNGEVQPDNNINRMSEDGKWEFIIADEVGNQSYFCFYKYTHEINKVNYNTPYGYRITSATHTINNATLPLTIPFSPELNCSNVEIDEDGYYEMVMTNTAGEMYTFHFTISTILPTATLVGCEDKGLCLREVSLDGLESGDKVFVYRDGELVSTYSILTMSDSVVMSDAGDYKVVIRNLAGNEVVYNFTKKLVMNTAGSVLIIVLNAILAIALFVGILYRTKSKIDG